VLYPDARVKPRPPRKTHHAGDWLELATPTPTKWGIEWIMMSPHAGAYSKLRIDAVSGVVYLQRVTVKFADGTSQIFNVGRRLSARRPSAFIDFGRPRQMTDIIVATARRPAGEYAIYGAWGTVPDATVALR
jgi:hypothetical protein